jgi:hypothetical protein
MKLGNGSRRDRGMNLHHQRRPHQDHHRDHVDREVVAEVVVERGVDRVDRVGHEQRVAVGRRAHRHLGANVVSAAGTILDEECLAEPLGEPLRDDARRNIGRAARRSRDNDAHRASRIVLCACRARCQRQRCDADGTIEEFAAGRSHRAVSVLPDRPPGNRSCLARNSIMSRLNSQGCSIWQACPAPGSTFISQPGMRACSANAF